MNEIDAINEFREIVNGIAAVFVDAREGFELLQNKLEVAADTHGVDKPIYFGNGPSGQASTVAVATTLGERIGRNACDAENCTFVGNMALVSIYGFWEDHYRKIIAHSLGMEKNELQSHIMGDVRNLRTSIVHNRAVATESVSSNKILSWFEPGDEVFLSQPMYLQMMGSIHEYLDQLENKARSNNAMESDA